MQARGGSHGVSLRSFVSMADIKSSDKSLTLMDVLYRTLSSLANDDETGLSCFYEAFCTFGTGGPPSIRALQAEIDILARDYNRLSERCHRLRDAMEKKGIPTAADESFFASVENFLERWAPVGGCGIAVLPEYLTVPLCIGTTNV